jgi:DNA-directed RNA polymerase specialized sigma24 family protein
MLAAMTSRHREVLRLHYYEQLSATEIARHLGTTRRYAEKLIGKALKQARRLLASLDRGTE